MKFQKMRYTVLLTALLISMVCFADDFTLKGKVVDEEEHALELVTVSCPAQGKVTMMSCSGKGDNDQPERRILPASAIG